MQGLGAVPFDLVKFRAFFSLSRRPSLPSSGSGFRRRIDGEAEGIKMQVLTRQRQLMQSKGVLPLEEAAATA